MHRTPLCCLLRSLISISITSETTCQQNVHKFRMAPTVMPTAIPRDVLYEKGVDFVPKWIELL